MLGHECNSLSRPLLHALNNQNAQNKNITEHPVTPLPANNALPLHSNNRNQTPQMDTTTYLNKSGGACMIP